MEFCQNAAAAKFALPEKPMPVRDRSLTLSIQCTDPATYASSLTGLGVGKARTGGRVQSFPLCDNHSQLFAQIDKELIQEGWAATENGSPSRLA